MGRFFLHPYPWNFSSPIGWLTSAPRRWINLWAIVDFQAMRV
jgi:hypothetical protein